MSVEKIKKYTNGEITVVWKPEKCYHAGKCSQLLPEVYKPKERPWIQLENGATDEIREQIKTCPSGALTYYMNENPKDCTEANQPKVEVLENGPLVVYGKLKIEESNGELVERDAKTAFCRCGQSDNKPFCDGSHMKANWKG